MGCKTSLGLCLSTPASSSTPASRCLHPGLLLISSIYPACFLLQSLWLSVPFAFTVGPSLPLAFFSSSSLSLIRDSTISLVSSPVPCMCRHLINFCQMSSLMAYWWGFQVYGCDPGSVPSWGTERSCKLCSKARKKQKFKTKKMPKKFSFCQMNGCGSMRTWVQILPLTKYIALASHLFDL